MIIFLYGEDSYRRLEKLNEILRVYRLRHSSLSEARFDLSLPQEIFRFKEFIMNRSMFDTSKLAVLDNAFGTSEVAELKNILKSELRTKDSTIIISSDEKPKAELDFLRKMPPPSKAQQFNKLEGTRLNAFIKEEASKRKLKLSATSTEALKDVFQGDSWALVTEIEKLSLSQGRGDKARNLSQENFYELISSLRFEREIPKKLVLLELLLSDLKEDSAKVFNVLAWRAGGELLRLFADYDIAVKSGRLEYEEVLTDFALL